MKQTRPVQIGKLKIGGGNPISIQSMCNTDTRNSDITVKQILNLEKSGCEIIRVAVPDMIAAKAIKDIKKNIHIPLVADIHFDYKLALESIKNGVDKVRINPGNIGSNENVKKVVDACKDKNIPIRIGINTGSLEKEAENKYGRTAQAMVESALKHIQILEKLNFHDIIISLKASDIQRTVESYRLLSQKVDYPLHLGITEAGTLNTGTIKSSVGLGIMLFEGLGDTIRVSLTGDPVEEVRVGWEILKSLKLRDRGVNLISCPTCGRTEINLISLANKIEKSLVAIKKPITVAVMGCVVNGPGEAKEADIGVAGGHHQGVIFKKGQILYTVPENKIVSVLLSEIEKL